MPLFNFLKKLPSIGVTPDLDRLTVQKIRVTNGLFFMGAPLFIYYSVHNILTYDGIVAIFYIISLSLGSIVVFLNYKKHYSIANIYSILFNVLICFLVQFLFGSELVLESLVLVYVVFAAYIIDNRIMAILLVLFISISFLGLKYIEQFYPPPLAYRILSYTPLGFFIFSVLIVSFFIFDRRNEIEAHLEEKDHFENQLQNKNVVLAAQKELIEKQNLDLETKNDELNQFAYIAAHDLKSPVRSILSFAQLSKMNMEKENYEKVNEFLDIISTSTTHLNDLIKDLLSFSLLEKESIDKEQVDLNEIFNSSLMFVNDKLKNPIDVKAQGLTKAFVNPLQFKLLFQNLIENGIKYNRNEIPEILVEEIHSDGKHIIKFKDNGIGIEDKYKRQIFEMFKRLHTSDEFEGSGLGLAICKKIIDRHNGSIYVSDSTPNGTEFTIEWPSEIPLIDSTV